MLIPLTLALGVAVAVAVASAGEETQIEIDYLDEIRDQTSELAKDGSSLASLFARMRVVSREEFTTVFDGLRSDLDVSIAFVQSEPPIQSLLPVWSLYRQAIEAWDRGVTGLGSAILAGADNPDDALVVNQVADSLAELRAGDNLYMELKSEMTRDEIPQPVAPLTNVRLSPGDGGLTRLAVAYLAAARSTTNGLGMRPGLTVAQIKVEPSWQLSVSGQAVIPATDTVTFSVIITNGGNIASDPETLTLRLVGGPDQVILQLEIPALSPLSQTTLTFEPIDVIADTLYEVEARLEVNNPDADLTDNSLQVQFTVNPS